MPLPNGSFEKVHPLKMTMKMKRDYKESSPRTFSWKQEDWVKASKEDVKIWKEGRRARYEEFRLAWINSQPHAFVESTQWEFATQSGLILRIDPADTISRITDFVCVITGIKEVITPPDYPPSIPIDKASLEKMSDEEREVLLASFEDVNFLPAQFDLGSIMKGKSDEERREILASIEKMEYNPTEDTYFLKPYPRYGTLNNEYPSVVIDCVTAKLLVELSKYFANPSAYDVDEDDPEDTDEVFRPPILLPYTLADYYEYQNQHAFRIPPLTYCEPFFRTSGGSLGIAEKRCLRRTLIALDGITPGIDNWWASKKGPKDYYKSASYYRFAIYEALLWWKIQRRKPIQKVTLSNVIDYLNAFEFPITDERIVYNKLQKYGLPAWKVVKEDLIRLIR